MRANGVEAAIARYREAGTKKDARNRNCAQMGSAYLGVLLYSISLNKHGAPTQYKHGTRKHFFYSMSLYEKYYTLKHWQNIYASEKLQKKMYITRIHMTKISHLYHKDMFFLCTYKKLAFLSIIQYSFIYSIIK